LISRTRGGSAAGTRVSELHRRPKDLEKALIQEFMDRILKH
jgi:hypothetical protein